MYFRRNNFPAEVGDDIELKAVQLQFPSARTLDKNASLYKVQFVVYHAEIISTK